jgi:glycosyltransferase involved in cell wall biosynthesis
MNTEVSICLPVYNEAKSIKFVLQEWTKILERLKVKYNIICSEDGSSDGTKKILKSLSKKNKKIINNSSIFRRGYGKAVISGIEKSKSKYIVCIDSDGQCDPGDFIKFWKK